jgi:hypothetical protein
MMGEVIRRDCIVKMKAFEGVPAHLRRPLYFLGVERMLRRTIDQRVTGQRATFGFGITVAVALLLLFCITPTQAQSALAIEKIKVIKISAPDKSAVIKIAAGSLKLIRVGADVEGLGKVVEIAEGLIVLEVKGDKRNEQIIIRLENGKQTIERIRTVTDEKPLFSAGQPPQNKKR